VTQLVDGNKGIHAMLSKRYCPNWSGRRRASLHRRPLAGMPAGRRRSMADEANI